MLNRLREMTFMHTVIHTHVPTVSVFVDNNDIKSLLKYEFN